MSDDIKYMRLGNGDLIDTKTGKRVAGTEINKAFGDPAQSSPTKATRRKPLLSGGRRRYLDDLPLPADQSRAVALVASYSVYGLSSADIAYIAKVDVELVEQVQDSEAFSKFLEGMLQNIREFDQDVVRKKLNDAASKAAEKVVELTASVDEKVALAASKDVLDRSRDNRDATGNGSAGGGLVIRIIDDRNDPSDKLKVDVF